MATNIAVETLAELAKERNKPQSQSEIPLWFTEMMNKAEERHLQERRLDAERHARELDALGKRLEQTEKAAQERPKGQSTTQEVIEMARTIIPPPPPPPQDNRMVDMLMQLLKSTEERALQERKLDAERHARDVEMLAKRLEAQEARAAALEAARLAQPATQSKSAIQEAISLVKALRGATEELGSEATGTGNPYVDAAMELGPKILDTITTVASSIRNAPPAPMSQQSPQQPGTALQQQVQPTALTAEEQMIERIKAQLLQALGQNMHGSMFGGGVMFEYGENVYNYLSQLKENGLMQMLQRDGVYWGQIQQVASRVNIPQFMTDFLNGPAVIDRFQAIRAGQGQRPTGQVTPPRQTRSTIVDSPPASEVPQTGGRTIIREGGPVKTMPPVNGGIVEPIA